MKTLVFASGCSGSGSAAPVSGVEKPDLNVAVVPALDSAGFFVALYDGLFAKEGLHVNFTPAASSDTVISAQVKGQYDITGGNYVSYIQAEAAGQANLDIFAEGSVMTAGAQGIYVMPDSPIKSLAQLKNKTVAINMALDDYPFANTVGGVDPHRLQRVVDVMQQFLGFNSSFNINSMLIGG
jgi:NitT/TauT family transport system substrate-binding protein